MPTNNKYTEIQKSLTKEQQFHIALDQHAIVSITDVKGTIIYVNDKFCNISGYSQKELIGHNHRILSSGLHEENFFKTMWRQIATGKTWHGNICNKAKNGELYWVESSITPILNEKNKPIEYISIRTDISHIKKSEIEALKADKRQTKQQAMLMLLVNDQSIYDYSICSVFETITNLSCAALDSNNAAIWSLNDKKNEFVCDMCYSNETLSYTHGNTLIKKHNASFFSQLQTKRIINSSNIEYKITITTTDNQSAQHNLPAATLLSPIWSDGDIIGLFSVSPKKAPRLWFADEHSFVIALSDIISQLLKNSTNKKLTEQLKVSQQRLSNAHRIANMGYWIWNINQQHFYWSDEMYAIYGVNKDEFTPSYDNFYKVIHDNDNDRIQQFEEQIKSGVKEQLTYQILRDDGEKRHLYLRAEVEYIDDTHVNTICGTVIDVTEQVELRNQLAHQKDIFESIFRDSKDSLILADINRKIILVNPAFTDLFGYSLDEIIGKTTAFLYAKENDYIKQGEKRYNVETAQKATDKKTRVYSMLYKKKNGDSFMSSTIGSVLYDANNKPHGFLGHIRDITQQNNHKKRTLIAKQQAEHASHSKSLFLSRMSHELRTPLNAIIGFSELLKMDSNDFNPDQQSNIVEIMNAGYYLLKLINDILDLSKIESGDLTITVDSVNCLTAIEECISSMESLALVSNISIQIVDKELLENQPLIVSADPTRLRQVLINLLSNALKYNKRNGKIDIKCHATSKQTITITIIDSGIGLSEKNIKELFVPFKRFVDDPNTIEGTGIGLSICKNLIELMSGSIHVSSKLGIGSEFSIKLKAATQNNNNQKTPSNDSTVQAISTNDTILTVIYIEDNTANMLLVTALLKKLNNINLISATNAEHGLELIHTQLPDLILLDINLPCMNGYDLCKLLKNENKTAAIPIIALSANAMKENIKQALNSGFHDYITKPLDIHYFYQVIEKFKQQKQNVKN